MFIEKLREVNPKRAEILERLLGKSKKQAETGKLLAEGLRTANTLAQVREAAKNALGGESETNA